MIPALLADDLCGACRTMLRRYGDKATVGCDQCPRALEKRLLGRKTRKSTTKNLTERWRALPFSERTALYTEVLALGGNPGLLAKSSTFNLAVDLLRSLGPVFSEHVRSSK